MDAPRYPVDSWEDYRRLIDSRQFRGWAFRGHASHRWSLLSTLSRHFRLARVHEEAWGLQERRILRIFKRQAHLLLSRVPDGSDEFEWLALMQHHGAPTRLLDFTWSPYVAAFFALSRAEEPATVWAVHPPTLLSHAKLMAPSLGGVRRQDLGLWFASAFETEFNEKQLRFAVIGEPHHMNRRLTAQSGTFVVPGALNESLESFAPDGGIARIDLNTENVRRPALRDMYNMNIKESTLFPDLDGLARSLAYELETHWGFDPVTNERLPGFEMLE